MRIYILLDIGPFFGPSDNFLRCTEPVNTFLEMFVGLAGANFDFSTQQSANGACIVVIIRQCCSQGYAG